MLSKLLAGRDGDCDRGMFQWDTVMGWSVSSSVFSISSILVVAAEEPWTTLQLYEEFVCTRSRSCVPHHFSSMRTKLEQGSVSTSWAVQHSRALTSLLRCLGNVVADLGWPDQCDLIILRRKQLQQVAQLIIAGSLPAWTSSSSCLTFTTFGLPKHSNRSDCATPWDNQVTSSTHCALCTTDLDLFSTHTLPGISASSRLKTPIYTVSILRILLTVC